MRQRVACRKLCSRAGSATMVTVLAFGVLWTAYCEVSDECQITRHGSALFYLAWDAAASVPCLGLRDCTSVVHHGHLRCQWQVCAGAQLAKPSTHALCAKCSVVILLVDPLLSSKLTSFQCFPTWLRSSSWCGSGGGQRDRGLLCRVRPVLATNELRSKTVPVVESNLHQCQHSVPQWRLPRTIHLRRSLHRSAGKQCARAP